MRSTRLSTRDADLVIGQVDGGDGAIDLQGPGEGLSCMCGVEEVLGKHHGSEGRGLDAPTLALALPIQFSARSMAVMLRLVRRAWAMAWSFIGGIEERRPHSRVLDLFYLLYSGSFTAERDP